MVKIVSLFLIGMLVLALFGRLRAPRLPRLPRLRAQQCPACGRPRIGRGPCPCGKDSG